MECTCGEITLDNLSAPFWLWDRKIYKVSKTDGKKGVFLSLSESLQHYNSKRQSLLNELIVSQLACSKLRTYFVSKQKLLNLPSEEHTGSPFSRQVKIYSWRQPTALTALQKGLSNTKLSWTKEVFGLSLYYVCTFPAGILQTCSIQQTDTAGNRSGLATFQSRSS